MDENLLGSASSGIGPIPLIDGKLVEFDAERHISQARACQREVGTAGALMMLKPQKVREYSTVRREHNLFFILVPQRRGPGGLVC